MPWRWGGKSQGNTHSPEPVEIRRYLSLFLWNSLLCLGVGELVLIALHGAYGANDFCEDYASVVSLLHGRPPYSPAFCFAANISVLGGAEYNSHPPTSILMYLPFGLLPKITAMIVWGLLSLGAYFISVWLLLRALHWPVLPGLALVAFGSIFWAPAASATWVLNTEQALLLLLVGAWLLAERKQDSWAGVLLGIACLLKIWPVIILVLPLLQRRWRLVTTAGLVVMTGTMLALLVAGPSAFLAYLGPVRIAEQGWVALASQWNVSLTGAVVGLLRGYTGTGTKSMPLWPADSARTAALLGEVLSVGLLLGVLCLLWWKRHYLQSDSGQARLAFGLLVTLILVAFPLSWPWGIISLFLPATLLVLALRGASRPPRWWWWLLGAGLILINIEYLPILASIPELPLLLLQHLWLHPAVLSRLVTVVATLPTLGVLIFAAAETLLLIQQSTGDAAISPTSPGGRACDSSQAPVDTPACD